MKYEACKISAAGEKHSPSVEKCKSGFSERYSLRHGIKLWTNAGLWRHLIEGRRPFSSTIWSLWLGGPEIHMSGGVRTLRVSRFKSTSVRPWHAILVKVQRAHPGTILSTVCSLTSSLHTQCADLKQSSGHLRLACTSCIYSESAYNSQKGKHYGG